MKNDILIFHINNWDKQLTSQDGYYYVIKVNNNCYRFDNNTNEIVLELQSGVSYENKREMMIQIYLFKRQPRTKLMNEKFKYEQRIRSIIDHFQFRLNDIMVTTIRETYADWDNIDVTFPIAKSWLQLAVELYPATPILPGKLANGSILEEELPYYMNLTVAHDLVVESKGLSKNVTDVVKSNVRKSVKLQQANIMIIGKFVKNIMHKSKHKHESVDSNNTDDLYLDIDNARTSYTDSMQSSVMNDLPQSNSTSLIECDLEIAQSIKNYDHDALPLETTAKTFFNNFENRIIYNQHIDWTPIFEPSNVRTTGYIGNGKWVSSQVSNSLMLWYLKEDVMSIKPPKKPPKLCPKGILWEEYYLMNQNELLLQYSR